MFIEEIDAEKRLAVERRQQLFSVRRDAILKDYAYDVRKELHEGRALEKKKRNDEAFFKYVIALQFFILLCMYAQENVLWVICFLYRARDDRLKRNEARLKAMEETLQN